MQWFLSPLHPASLMHKNPWRCKIIDWLIDRSEDAFEEYPVCVISVAVMTQVLLEDFYLFGDCMCTSNEALTIKGGPIKFFNSLIQSDSAGHSKLVYAIHLVLFTDSQEKKLSFLIDGGVMRVCLMNNDAVTIFFFIFFLLKNKWVRGSERGSLIQQHSIVSNKLLFCLYYSRDIQD